jgi:hypothetical protein
VPLDQWYSSLDGEERHSIRVRRSLKHDPIFADLFRKLEQPG